MAFIPKLPGINNGKTRFLYIAAGVLGIAVLGYTAYRFLGGGTTTTAAARVAAPPSGLQSVPGSQLSPEYYAALKQANTQAAQQAQISGGSAVPTLVNVPGNYQQGSCIVCPSETSPDVVNEVNDLLKAGKLSQEDANRLNDLAKQNVSPDEYAAELDRLVREGKLTPEQARKLLADYKKQHDNALLAESAKTLDAAIKSGQLPLAVANQVLDLQKMKLTPAEYQTELQRLVREGKLTPEQSAQLLAQYTQQQAKEKAKANQFQLTQLAKAGEITPAVAAQLTDLQNRNASVEDYAAALDRLVKEGKLTPEAAAKLLAQYKQQKLGAALTGCLGNLMRMGGDRTTEANLLLSLQSKNAPVADYLTELKRGVSVGLVTPDLASCLMQEYQAAMAPPQAATEATPALNIPGSEDFNALQQRLQQQGQTPTTPPPIGADQFSGIQAQAQAQTQAVVSADTQQQITDAEAAMSAQAQQLIATAWAPPTMEHKGGSSADQAGGKTTTTTTSATTTSSSATTLPTGPTGPVVIKAGTIYYALLDTGANSDYPDTPIMATVILGPYKGAKLLGKMALAQSQGASQPDRMSLTFTSMSFDAWPSNRTINAFAIDPDTARTVLATSVDYHYLKKYGATMATAFLSGYASAITNAGTSTTGIFGTSTTHPALSAGSKLAVGLGQIGTSLSSTVQAYTQIPPTVRVDAGVGLGILFMNDVTQ